MAGCLSYSDVRNGREMVALANALAVTTVTGVDTDDLTLVDEQRYANLCAGLYRSRLERVGSRIALQTRLRIGHSELNLRRQLGEQNGVARCIGYNIYYHTFLQEIYTRDQVMSDRYLLEGLVIHEDVVLALFVKELVRTALNANILQLLTDVEAALQHTAVHYILKFHAHNRVALTRLHVQKLDYEIQTAVHADTYAVFNVLTVNHKIITIGSITIYLFFIKIAAKLQNFLHICKFFCNFALRKCQLLWKLY